MRNGRITMHILDTSRGRPAAGISARLEVQTPGGWHEIGSGVTNDDGRISFDVPKEKTLRGGRHRLRLVVAGDHTSTDLLVDVVPKHTKIFVSDA